MTPRHLRTLRGAAAAWVATVVAATSHTLAGGGAPAPALVGVVGVLAWPVAIALVGRRLTPWGVAAAVLAAQTFFHTAFAVSAGPAAPGVGAAPGVHDHHALLPADAAAAASLLPDAPMLVGHVLAAIVTVCGLYFGERMLRALGRGIRSILARVSPSPLAPRGPVEPRPSTPPRATPRTVVLSDLSRRGPPALVDAIA